MKIAQILSVLLIILAASSCRFWGVRGSGDIEYEFREVENFSRLEIAGAFTVKVIVGEEPRLEISADDNLLKYITTRVSGDKLVIESRKSLSPRRGIKIRISTRNLESLEASGASTIDVEGIKGESFTLDVSGAGSLNLQGETKTLKADMSGAASLKARDLRAEKVKIEISGASSAKVFASEAITAEVSGVGSVDFYGDPKTVKTNVSGIGSIKRK